ncbi:hypothetical protein ACEPAH_73 [Sanghuangporus vaninii]
MLNGFPISSSSLASSIKSSSVASSSSSRFSVMSSLRRSYDSDMKHSSQDSYRNMTKGSQDFAENMDDENIAWGPASRKKHHS